MVSPPTNTAKLLFHGENGINTIEEVPLSMLIPGLAQAHNHKMAWHIIQKLKIYIPGIGYVTPVTPRSRYPLDPHGLLTAEEKEELASLDTIHLESYNREWANLSNKEKEGPNERTVMKIIWILAALIALSIVGLLIKGVAV